MIDALLNVYSIQPYQQQQQQPTPASPALIATLKSKIEASGAGPAPSDMQRLVALVLLLRLSPKDAAEIAARIVADESATEWSRLDAMQIRLLALPFEKARTVAVEALQSDCKALRKVALPFLAMGASAVQEFHGSIHVYYFNVRFDPNQSADQIAAGAQLTVDRVKPFLNDADPQLAAYAGYLAASLRDPTGIDPLLKRWRQTDRDVELSTLLTQAIVQLKDDDRAPLLEEIAQSYRQNEPYQMRSFLQSIATMNGPKVTKLRERLAKDLPKDN